MTDRVGAAKLLLRADIGALSSGGVESRFTLDDLLFGACSTATGLATNLGDGVPVVHVGGCCVEC